jgi:aminocarboxymuconate-semialdehyde decarboxylase
MTTRRQLIQGAATTIAGIAFTGCSSLDNMAKPGQSAGGGKPPQLVVNGKRVQTIDVHTHCYIPEALALMSAEDVKAAMPPVKGQKEHIIVIEERLKAMDAMGIDMEVLSINPFWYRRERENSAAICRMQNQKMSELCAARPDRFSAFASLPMQFPDLAEQMLEEAMKLPGIRGAAIGGSVAGQDFSDPKFAGVLAKAEQLGAVLFIHPQSTPELAKRFQGNGWLSNVIGNPLDTTIALNKLIFEGTLDKFPKLKVCAAHGGGYFGSYKTRSDVSCFVSPQNCNPNIKLKKKPSEYVDQIYFDALVFTAEGLRHLVAEVGISQVVIGTDHPIPWEQHPVEHVLGTPSLSDADRAAILSGNARRMLGLS